jgi:uncharacterized membrane protein
MSVSRKYYGLILAVALGDAIAIALFLALGGGALRVLVALPFVLVLPGLALTLALFPAGALDTAERILFSLGLSLAVTALSGLALHLTPWGLRPATWATLLGHVTLAAGGAAYLRRRGRPRAGAASPPRRGLTGAQALCCALAALVLAGTLTVTVRGAQDQVPVGFTQLWIVPASGDQASVQLGLSNREPDTTAFRVQFEVDGRVRRTWTPTLASGATWEETVPLPADIPPTATIEAVLYRADSPSTIYRRVQLQRGQQ